MYYVRNDLVKHVILIGLNSPIQIVIMEICKVPILRLKALNKHNITYIMYIEMENVISNLTKS